MDIAQGAKKLVFCGTFEANGLRVERKGDALEILSSGSVPKAVKKVRHVTFSGVQARLDGKEVFYITERAVFRLDALGVCLVEVAKGLDMHRDVLSRMEFTPVTFERLKADGLPDERDTPSSAWYLKLAKALKGGPGARGHCRKVRWAW